MNDKVEIFPNIVVRYLMMIEAFFRIPFKSWFFNSANEANILCVVYNSNIDISQLCESIDNNTENNIQQNCNNQKEERQII